MVYFIQCRENVKIGFTRDIDQRLGRLRTSSPFPLELLTTIEGEEDCEKWFHAHFRSYRVQGEWFRLGPRIRKFVREVEERGTDEKCLPEIASLLDKPLGVVHRWVIEEKLPAETSRYRIDFEDPLVWWVRDEVLGQFLYQRFKLVTESTLPLVLKVTTGKSYEEQRAMRSRPFKIDVNR